MVLRETTFVVGGGVTIALGFALGAGLYWAGAGLAYAGVWLAAGMSVGFGGFFIYVGRQARAFRLGWRQALEEGRPLPPGGPPR